MPVGGISAGLAILGEFLFSAEKNTVTSDRALLDPYNNKITLQRDMLRRAAPGRDDHRFPLHAATHGRLLTFMARTITDGWATDVRGIGVDEETAVLVEADGRPRWSALAPAGSSGCAMPTSDLRDGRPSRPRRRSAGVRRGDGFDLTTFTGTAADTPPARPTAPSCGTAEGGLGFPYEHAACIRTWNVH